MALFRVFRAFLARFGVVVWVCVVLVLCVACVAFVRVRCLAVLGLVACLPFFCPFFFFFATVFILLSSAFLLCLSSGALPLLFSACPCGFLCGLLFLFPLRTMRKKRGRKGLSLASSLRVLWVCL